MRVQWTPRARDGFRREIRYIANDSPSAARHMAFRVQLVAGNLVDNPFMGRVGRVRDTRELVVAGTPFTIAYRIQGQLVEIVGVVHQAQHWPENFEV